MRVRTSYFALRNIDWNSGDYCEVFLLENLI